jgi:hypothetical protein
MKLYGRVDAQTHVFFTLALFGAKCSASHPVRFIPRENFVPPVPIQYEACYSSPVLWYRLPTANVPLPEFPKCPRATAHKAT